MLKDMKSDDACCLSVEDLARTLETDLNNGLSSYEVEVRKKIHGYNDFSIVEEAAIWKKYIEQVWRPTIDTALADLLTHFLCWQFKDPLIGLLIVSAIISVFMRQFDDAISITIAIIIVVSVGFIQVCFGDLGVLVKGSCGSSVHA